MIQRRLNLQGSVGTNVLASAAEEKPNTRKCVFCERLYHSIHTCQQFMDKSITERVQFVQARDYALDVLTLVTIQRNVKGEVFVTHAKGNIQLVCIRNGTKVRKNKEGDKEQKESKGIKDMKEIKQSKETPNETISHRIVQTHSSNLTSTISPVWLSTTNDPDHEILLYALLDSQSDTTFILQEKADALYCDKRHVQLRLSTLSSRDTVIPSERLYRAANQRLLFFKENSSSCNLHKRVYSC